MRCGALCVCVFFLWVFIWRESGGILFAHREHTVEWFPLNVQCRRAVRRFWFYVLPSLSVLSIAAVRDGLLRNGGDVFDQFYAN